jgi:hypothetical protein
MIPRDVAFIDTSAFQRVKLSSISIEDGNYRFVISNNELIDIVLMKRIAYMTDKLDSQGGLALFNEHLFTGSLLTREFPHDISESDSDSSSSS